MTDTQIAAKAAPDYAINHHFRCRDRSNSKKPGSTSTAARDSESTGALDVSAVFAVDIAPGEFGSLLPQGGWAIVDGADRGPAADRVYWVVVNGDPKAMRCVAAEPHRFAPIACADNERPPVPVKGRAIWAVLGRVISYGAEVGR